MVNKSVLDEVKSIETLLCEMWMDWEYIGIQSDDRLARIEELFYSHCLSSVVNDDRHSK